MGQRQYYFRQLVCVAAWFALAAVAWADDASSRPANAGGNFPQQAEIARLIENLGSDRFVERKSAEQALLDRGMEVFDQIDAATSHADPEIATSCKYLLSQLTVLWARRDDPPAVKNFFARYSSFEQQQRIAQANQLSQLPHAEGAAALVRIARYDPSPEVANYAAMYLLRRDDLAATWPKELAAVLRNEAGSSARPAVDWVRALAVQIESPEQAVAAWGGIIDRFRAQVSDSSYSETTQQQYATLLWNLFRVGVQQADWNAAAASIDELVSAMPSAAQQTLSIAMNSAIEQQAWPVLDHVLENHRDKIEGAKQPLYFAAHARFVQGREDEAQELANSALAAPDGQSSSQVVADAMQIAFRLTRDNHIDWARREYEAAIESAPPGSATHAFACWWLADSLHDWQEDKQASEVIGKLASVLRNDTTASANYRRIQSRRVFGGSTATLPSIDLIFAKEHYFLGLHHLAAGDRTEAWNSFKQACDHDSTDSDILIGMYRASEPDSAERNMTLKKIEQLSQAIQQEIDAAPSDPVALNHWAWLISNTTGDYDKALRFSQKSLELRPDTASFLDTLGRCYFAVGDLENAIKYQRQAVELEPSTRILKRQLDEFEAALAKQQGEQTPHDA